MSSIHDEWPSDVVWEDLEPAVAVNPIVKEHRKPRKKTSQSKKRKRPFISPNHDQYQHPQLTPPPPQQSPQKPPPPQQQQQQQHELLMDDFDLGIPNEFFDVGGYDLNSWEALEKAITDDDNAVGHTESEYPPRTSPEEQDWMRIATDQVRRNGSDCVTVALMTEQEYKDSWELGLAVVVQSSSSAVGFKLLGFGGRPVGAAGNSNRIPTSDAVQHILHNEKQQVNDLLYLWPGDQSEGFIDWPKKPLPGPFTADRLSFVFEQLQQVVTN